MTDFAERNRRILEMSQQGYTLRAIGQELGVSKDRVRQIVQRGDKEGQGKVAIGKRQAEIKEQNQKIQLIKDEYEVRRKALDEWYQTEMDAVLNRTEYRHIPIEALGMGAKANRIMKRENVNTIEDVLNVFRYNPGGDFNWRGFGDYTVAELKKKLKEAGFAIPDSGSKD